MPESCAALIDQLIQRRHDIGMTQIQLAKVTNLSQPVIARLEGKKAIPQLDTLIKVATALNCRVELVPTAN